MNIEQIKLDDYFPSPFNPRRELKPGDSAYESIRRSLDEFDYIVPLVVNKRSHRIVSGHQRANILREKGITHAEAVIVDFEETKEKAAVLALNKVTGEWDQEKLGILLDELSRIPDFDETITGFDFPEISEILDECRGLKDEDDFDCDAVAQSITEPVTKMGDLIELGPHRIICGDAAEPEILDALFQGEKANLLHCDFPYNVSKKSRNWKKIYNDDLPQKEYEEWMGKIFKNILRYLIPGSSIYVWQGHRQFPPMYQILLNLGFHVSCVLVWLKQSVALTYADYCFRTEQCLYGWLEGAPHFWAGKPGESNVWEIKRDPTKSYVHPTQKPIALPQNAIRNSSKPCGAGGLPPKLLCGLIVL